MSRVMVLMPLGGRSLDLTTAERYGEIEYIFQPGERRCSIFDVNKFVCTVIDILEEKKFDYKTDSVCIVGSMVPLVVASMGIARHYPSLRLLLFDSTKHEYVARTIDISERTKNERKES